MKDHQRAQGIRQPEPTVTDPNAYEVGQVVHVTVLGVIVAVRPAGHGRATLKIDTRADGQSEDSGQWVYVMTDLGDQVDVEVL